jgi:hypothetical protein
MRTLDVSPSIRHLTAALIVLLSGLAVSQTVCSEESDPVVRLYLVDVRTGKDLYEITEGGVLNLNGLKAGSTTIRAQIVGRSPREVVFDWNNMRRYRAETAAPYSLAGDVGGKYHAWVPKLGRNTIAVRLNGSGQPVLRRAFVVQDVPGAEAATFTQRGGTSVSAETRDDGTRASLRPESFLPEEPQPAQPEIRINCGGSSFIDREGREWSADEGFGEGGSYGLKNYSDDFTGTAVFRNGRDSRAGPLRYAIPVQPGGYEVVLHFMELYAAGGGKRVFDVIAEGNTLVSDLDISQRVGAGAPLSLTRFVAVTDGVLNIEFRPKVGLASVAAIEVLPRSGQ